MNVSVVFLSLSALISSAGTTLFVSALALSLFSVDSSAVKASGVYIAQFLPAIFLLPLAVRICDRYAVREGLVKVELVSAMVTVIMGLCVQFDWLLTVYLILAIRGFLELTTKTFRSVGVKNFADATSIDKANNFVMGGGFLGQAVGALAGFILVSKIPLLTIAIIDGLTYAASAIFCMKMSSADAIKKLNSHVLRSTWAGFVEIRENKILRLYFMCFSLVVIIFQSYNQVARTWIPLAWLDMGLGKGIVGEMIGCLGIVLGVLIVNFFMSSASNRKLQVTVSIVFAAMFVGAPFITINSLLSLFLYFIYMVFFEVALMVSMNGLLSVCPENRVASVMALFYGVSFGGLTVIGFSVAFAADIYGLPIVSLVLSAVAVLLLFLIYFSSVFSSRMKFSLVKLTFKL